MDGAQSVRCGDCARAVDGLVADLLDDLGLGEDSLADRLPEGRLVDQRAQVILVGQPQRAVVAVEPRDREFQ